MRALFGFYEARKGDTDLSVRAWFRQGDGGYFSFSC